MKRLKRILSWTIWSLLLLYVGLLLFVNLSPVQSWLGDRAAAALSAKLGTKATVGRISMGLFNRVIIDDVYLADQQGDTLLHAGRLSVKAELLPLLEGRIAITSAQLFGTHVRLYKADEQSPANYQFVIDALSSADTTATSTPELKINSLIVRHSNLSFDRGDAVTTPGEFNLAHISISDISTHIALKVLTEDSLNVHLKRLSMKEHSGLSLESLTARLEAGHGNACLSNLSLQLPNSSLAIDTLEATYDDSRIKETLCFAGSIDSPAITFADLTPLGSLVSDVCRPSALSALPSLSLYGEFSGTANSIDCPRLRVLSSDGSLVISASGAIDAGGSVTAWSLQTDQFDVNAATLSALADAIPSMPAEILRLGNIHLTSKARRQHDGQTAGQADVSTSIGNATLLFTLDKEQMLNAEISTDSLHLGRLLDNDDLGNIAAHVNLSGNKEQVDAHATVAHLAYKGYDYSNMEINGFYQPTTRNAAGRLAIDNSGVKADVEGSVSTVDKSKMIRLAGRIDNICPASLNISQQWGDAAFAATIDADITASSINDAEGHCSVDDFTMRTGGDSTLCHIDHFTVTATGDDAGHRLKAKGDMGEVELRGQINPSTLPQSMARYLASKLPTLPGLPSDAATVPGASPSGPSNNFTATLHLSDTQWMQPLFGIPLTLVSPLTLTATIDDNSRYIDLKGQMPAFTYSGSRYRDMDLNIVTQGDTALCQAALTRTSDDGGTLKLDLDLKAANNNIVTALQWDSNTPTEADTMNTISGTINTITQLYTNDYGKPEAHVRVEPSLVMMGKKPWHIRPSNLTYSDNSLRVDSFVVRHGQQHLIIDGMASESTADTLAVDMNGLEIAYIQDLLDFHPVDFAGLLGGRAYATALFGKFTAWADICAPGFRFMDGRMGTLNANVRWNEADGGQIDIDAVADDGPTSKTFIRGYVSPTRSDIDLNIRAEGSNIEFCHSFTDSFLRDISGNAHGNVELAGPLGDMNLTGVLTVDGQVTVDALNTTYLLHNDSVHFVPDDIQFRGITVRDKDSNTATISGGIHHHTLSDFTFDINVDAQNMLVYDFPDFNGSNICGTVYATGNADIHGRPGEITINCNVTPQAGSTFAYNAANPDAVSSQEFITWGIQPTNPEACESEQTLATDSPSSQTYTGSDLQPTNIGSLTDLRINFLINATPDATLRLLMDANTGDYITLNGEGTIRATFHNRGPFQMFGTYTVNKGTYGITIQNIIKKNFTFQDRGTIVFGGDPYDATLNLQAVHTVNGVSLSDLNIGSNFASNTVRVNCLMNIQGTPNAPRVEFDLDMPTVNSEETQMIRSIIASEQEMNQQVLYLLGIGRFYTQGANNADAQQYGQTTLAMQSFLSGTVSTQINEVLSQVIKSNDWNFGANISTGDEGWRNAEYEGMVSGRLLDNRLLINGQFGYRDNATQATPSFIGDFDLQYLLKRNGNVAVKVYNQTNDRYFTRSSLNTQGVGLILKKDFDGLGELLRRKNKTSKSKQ